MENSKKTLQETCHSSIYGIVSNDIKLRYFKDQINQERKFNQKGLLATANLGPNLNSAPFFITLTDDEITSLHKKHTIFGKVVEGLEILDKFNKVYVD